MRRVLLALMLTLTVLGVSATAQATTTHQGRIVRYEAAGVQWGLNVDAQIRQALATDSGAETAFADSWLASGIAQRSAQGWDDPAALHYLQATLSQPNPYGLTYAWDAFSDGTVNPASTIYTVTLFQVGEVLLDAYKAGKADYTDVTDVMRLVINTPRIAVPTGMALAYSNSKNDVKAGYVVHNVNQAIALFLQDCQDAGIKWSDSQVRSWITKLVAYERSTYQPAIRGWAYRNGGSQSVQDAAHNGLGAQWGQRFYTATVGVPVAHFIETSDYGYVLGSGVHASLAQWECVASVRWLPQYQQYMADPAFQDFGSAAKATRMMAQSATACGTSAKASFTLKSKSALRGTKSTSKHVAPDSMVG